MQVLDFYMCDHEVTQKEFAQYYEGYEYRINENEKAIGDNYPAYDLNWFDALVYCNKGKENVLYAGGYYFYKQPDAFALSRSYASCMAITLAARNSQIGLRVVCTAD